MADAKAEANAQRAKPALGSDAAPWLGTLRCLRGMLDQELVAAKGQTAAGGWFAKRSPSDAVEPEKEIPESNQCNGKSGQHDVNMEAMLSELQELWHGPEAEEVTAILHSAAAMLKINLNQIQELHAQRGTSEIAASSTALGSSASEQLADGLQSRLVATRKALKDREWALAEARHRQQQLEDDRLRQDCRIRALETSLDRSTSSWSAAEQRHLETCSTAEVEAAEQQGQLRRRLSAAEVARDQALAELAAAEQRAEEARNFGERREQELQAELAESARELDDLRKELEANAEKEAASVDTSGAGDGLRQATPSVPVPRMPVDLSTLRIQGMPSGGILEEEGYLEGVGMVMATPRPHHQAAEHRPPTAPRGTPPKSEGPGGKRQTAAEPPSKRAAAPMPMDLRSLGRLLSGGGMLGK